jgi:uncharacterized protein involved in exopolysaccharide biosynthesis
MNTDPKERERLMRELKNLQATRDQLVQSRDRERELVRHYGSDHPTAKIAENKVRDCDEKITRLDREISSVTSRL